MNINEIKDPKFLKKCGGFLFLKKIDYYQSFSFLKTMV